MRECIFYFGKNALSIFASSWVVEKLRRGNGVVRFSACGFGRTLFY